MDAYSATTFKSCLKQQMKLRISLLIVFSCIMTASDWVIAITRSHTKALAVDAAPSTCIHLGRLISIQGQVQLKRKYWSDYHPTAVGAELCFGDLLRPVQGTKAIVQCADPHQNFWTVPDGVISGAVEGCRPPKKPIHTITKPINPTREPLARPMPYIISPKRTWLLSDKPTLRWQAVPGATSYVVRVSGPGVDWKTESSTTEIVYPGKPPLKPLEEGYLLTVEADNGESAALGLFGLLEKNQAALVRATAERIARQNLAQEAKTLATAELYIGQGLIAEATELLSASVALGSKTAAIHQMLGDLYVQVQLFHLAKKNYLQAVALATTTKDIEGQAVAAARLREVYVALGNLDAAAYWQQQVQKSFQALLSLKPIAH